MQAIFASSDLLERQLASGAHSRIAERIKIHARRMATLIDEVLDYVRARSGGEIGVALTEITDLNAALIGVIHEVQDDATDYRIQKVASNRGNVPMRGLGHHPLADTSQEGAGGFVPRRTNSLKC